MKQTVFVALSLVAIASLHADEPLAAPMSTLSAPPVTLTFGDIGDAVWEVAFSPDGRVLAGCSRLGRIRLWDAETTTPVRTLDGHKREIPSLLFSPDGRTLASASYDDTIRLWDPKTGNVKHILAPETKAIYALAYSPDGKTLVSGHQEGAIMFWDPIAGKLTRTVDAHEGYVAHVLFSPNAKTLASSGNQEIKFWSAIDATLIGAIREAQKDWFGPTIYSADGRRIITGHVNGVIKFRDVQSRTVTKAIQAHTGNILDLRLSSNGDVLASCGDDETIRLWRMPSGESIAVLEGHTRKVYSVAFSPNGKRIASGSHDATVKLWDISALMNPTAAGDKTSER